MCPPLTKHASKQARSFCATTETYLEMSKLGLLYKTSHERAVFQTQEGYWEYFENLFLRSSKSTNVLWNGVQFILPNTNGLSRHAVTALQALILHHIMLEWLWLSVLALSLWGAILKRKLLNTHRTCIWISKFTPFIRKFTTDLEQNNKIESLPSNFKNNRDLAHAMSWTRKKKCLRMNI